MREHQLAMPGFDRDEVFGAVTLDPPWLERGSGQSKRGADRHYPLLPTPEIAKLLKTECRELRLMREHAHAYLWVTDNFLEDGLWLLGELGYRYVRTIQWVKVRGDAAALDFETGAAVATDALELRFGIGQYARGAHEMMLFGVRGDGMDPSVCTEHRDIPSVILAPVPVDERGQRIHSRKPDASYELIERRSKGPYLEVFARRAYGPAWTCWGNQAPAVEAGTGAEAGGAS